MDRLIRRGPDPIVAFTEPRRETIGDLDNMDQSGLHLSSHRVRRALLTQNAGKQLRKQLFPGTILHQDLDVHG